MGDDWTSKEWKEQPAYFQHHSKAMLCNRIRSTPAAPPRASGIIKHSQPLTDSHPSLNSKPLLPAATIQLFTCPEEDPTMPTEINTTVETLVGSSANISPVRPDEYMCTPGDARDLHGGKGCATASLTVDLAPPATNPPIFSIFKRAFVKKKKQNHVHILVESLKQTIIN